MNTKITAVMAALVAAGLLAFAPAVNPNAFAQNTSVNTDDDYVDQVNKITQKQSAYNSANAGNTIGKDNIVAGNNAAAVSFQDQEAFAVNANIDDDVFETEQFDICVLVGFAFNC